MVVTPGFGMAVTPAAISQVFSFHSHECLRLSASARSCFGADDMPERDQGRRLRKGGSRCPSRRICSPAPPPARPRPPPLNVPAVRTSDMVEDEFLFFPRSRDVSAPPNSQPAGQKKGTYPPPPARPSPRIASGAGNKFIFKTALDLEH